MRQILNCLFIFLIYGCSSLSAPSHADDSQYISYVLKLPSPNGNQILYSYWVKYPDARHGHTRFIILPDTVQFIPSSDFFSFSDTLYGFNIEGWSGDTLKTVCITPSQYPPQELAPYNKVVTKLKESYWEQAFYYANSFGGDTEKYFDSLSYSHGMVTFVGTDTVLGQPEKFSVAAQKGQVTVMLGDSIIRVNRLEALTTIDAKYNGGDNIRKPPLVSLASYVLRPKREMHWKKLKDFGVFVEQPYSKYPDIYRKKM